MQGEEVAKVRETSLVPAMYRRSKGNDSEQWLSIRYNFRRANPENEREQTRKFRRGRQGRAGFTTFGLRALRVHGSRANPGKDHQRLGRRVALSPLALRSVRFSED